ncbi:hypothetical protein D3C84_833120 [compost metagenome]
MGGTTSGYSLIGNWNSAMAPAIRISSESTAAKIGRVIKNRENFMAVFLYPRGETAASVFTSAGDGATG